MESTRSIRALALVAGLMAVLVLACSGPSTPTMLGAEDGIGGLTAAGTAKVDVCHRSGNGAWKRLNVGAPALPAHLAHGDGQPHGAVPGGGYVFDGTCGVVPDQDGAGQVPEIVQ